MKMDFVRNASRRKMPTAIYISTGRIKLRTFVKRIRNKNKATTLSQLI